MILPAGLDAAPVRRVPWATLALAVACLGVFSLQGGPDEEAADQAAVEVYRYWKARPYLAPPEGMAARLPEARPPRPDRAGPPPAAPASVDDLAAEQAELQRRWDAFREAEERTFTYRYAFVPARGLLQPGLVTAAFLHGDTLHLAGNLLFLGLTGAVLLEDVWGAWLFLALWLAGGAAAWTPGLLDGVPLQPSLGASGAIAAVLGAVAVRLAHRRIRLLVFPWGLLRFDWRVPVWGYALFVFGGDLLAALRWGSGTGVAYSAHVAGFAFGALAAFALRRAGLEQRLVPGAAPPPASHALARADDALAGGDAAVARAELEAALAAAPSSAPALLRLARLEASEGRWREASRAALRHFAAAAEAGDAAAGARLLADLELRLELDGVAAPLAYRAAEALAGLAPELSGRFERVALADEGLVGLKARVRSAERLAAREPVLARARAAAVAAAPAAPASLRARAGAVLAALPPPAPAAAPATAPPPANPFEPPPFAEAPLELDHVGWTGGQGTAGPSPQVAAACAPRSVAPAPAPYSDGAEHVGARCDAHPAAAAGWRCHGCGGRLCPDCAASRTVAGVRLDRCSRCGGDVAPLLAHRRLLRPFGEQLLEPLRWPLAPGNRTGYLGSALLVTLVNLHPVPTGEATFDSPFLMALTLAIVYGLLFATIRATAAGEDQLGLGDFASPWRDLWLPLVRGLAATGFVWLSWLLLMAVREGGAVSRTVLLDRTTAAWVVGAWLYSPAALVVAAAGGTLWQVLAPDVVARVALRLGRDYLVAASAVGILVFGEFLALLAARPVILSGVPVASKLAGVAILLYLPLVAARLLGLLLRVRGDDLGLDDRERYLEPVLPGAAPRGRWPEDAAAG